MGTGMGAGAAGPICRAVEGPERAPWQPQEAHAVHGGQSRHQAGCELGLALPLRAPSYPGFVWLIACDNLSVLKMDHIILQVFNMPKVGM